MTVDSAHSPRGDDDPDAGNALDRLVLACQRGGKDAEAGLYERFAPYVHGLLLAYVPAEDAEDLTHDTFMTAFQRIRALRRPEAFGAWIGQIARNAARMRLRRQVRLVSIEEAESVPDPAQSAATDALDGARVLAAIRSLPVAYREPLILRLVEGLSGEDIAARTGLTAGSVRVNLHRGMAMLREKLGVKR